MLQVLPGARQAGRLASAFAMRHGPLGTGQSIELQVQVTAGITEECREARGC